MKTKILALMLVVASAGVAWSQASPSAGATIRDRVATIDGNGRPYYDPFALGTKVFAVENTSAATLLLDENGVAPKAGQLVAICVSSGAATDATMVFDSAVATGLGLGTTGRALFPPILATTTNANCWPNAGQDFGIQFNKGLVITRNVATGSAYVYWRPIGGKN